VLVALFVVFRTPAPPGLLLALTRQAPLIVLSALVSRSYDTDRNSVPGLISKTGNYKILKLLLSHSPSPGRPLVHPVNFMMMFFLVLTQFHRPLALRITKEKKTPSTCVFAGPTHKVSTWTTFCFRFGCKYVFLTFYIMYYC